MASPPQEGPVCRAGSFNPAKAKAHGDCCQDRCGVRIRGAGRSFPSQRDDRIDPRRASRRQVAREERDGQQERRDGENVSGSNGLTL